MRVRINNKDEDKKILDDKNTQMNENNYFKMTTVNLEHHP